MATTFREQVNAAAGLTVAGSFALQSTSVIDALNVTHEHVATYSDLLATTIATGRRVVHVANGTGTLVSLKIGLMVAMLSGATATIGLRKNGTEITSADLTLNDTVTAYTLVEDTGFSSASVVAEDVFEVEVKTAAAGGGTLGTGFFAQLVTQEEVD